MCTVSEKLDKLRISRTQNSLHQVIPIGRNNIKRKKTGETIMKVKTLSDSLDNASTSTESTLDSSLSSSRSRCSKKIRSAIVKFSDITIREYNLTLGDNPSCSSGAPVMLHWSYDPDATTHQLDLYEKSRLEFTPRTRSQMVLPMSRRHELLKKEWGVSTSDLLKIIKENKEIKESRVKSAMQQDRKMKAEEVMENIGSKFKNLIVKNH